MGSQNSEGQLYCRTGFDSGGLTTAKIATKN